MAYPTCTRLVVIHVQQDGGIQSAQGWSGFQGARRLLVDGLVPRQGSANAPFPGLDEVVSMKWSGVTGAGTPLCRWVQGERSLPRVIDRRNGRMALERAGCPDGATGRGDATGARSGPPSQDGNVKIAAGNVYITQLARSVFYSSENSAISAT